MDRGDLFDSDGFGGGRSAPELTALLLELGRLVKARRFYPAGDARLVRLFERGLRAWQADLARHGALELEVAAGGFRTWPQGETLGARQLSELVEELRARGVSRVRLDADIDAEALAGLVEVLATDRDTLVEEGGTEAALLARVPMGIALNEGARSEGFAREAFGPELGSEEEGEWSLDEPSFVDEPSFAAEPAEPGAAPSAGVGGETASFETGPADDGGSGDEVEWQMEDDPVADLSAPAAEATRTRAKTPPRAAPAPLQAHGAGLEGTLTELQECADASSYADAARHAVHEAERASEEGRYDDAYRVLVALARDATGGAKRSPRQADLARSFLSSLASGMRLTDLLDRACAPEHESSVEATQVLLALGEDVAASLIRDAETERDPARRGRMHGIVIALGEKALPELLRALEGDSPAAMRSAARLAGDIQNPAATSRLVALLDHGDAGVREEAAKALVRIGDPRALHALVRALRSSTPGLPALAVYCLAASGSPAAVRPLAELMEEAARDGRVELARETIRALGRLGREEAARPLAEVLLRRSLWQRRRLRDLKVAAAAALGALPGDEAVGALAQAVGARDPQIRRAAQMALERRAQALAGGRR